MTQTRNHWHDSRRFSGSGHCDRGGELSSLKLENLPPASRRLWYHCKARRADFHHDTHAGPGCRARVLFSAPFRVTGSLLPASAALNSSHRLTRNQPEGPVIPFKGVTVTVRARPAARSESSSLRFKPGSPSLCRHVTAGVGQYMRP
jgi:hypothetical protein